MSRHGTNKSGPGFLGGLALLVFAGLVFLAFRAGFRTISELNAEQTRVLEQYNIQLRAVRTSNSKERCVSELQALSSMISPQADRVQWAIDDPNVVLTKESPTATISRIMSKRGVLPEGAFLAEVRRLPELRWLVSDDDDGGGDD